MRSSKENNGSLVPTPKYLPNKLKYICKSVCKNEVNDLVHQLAISTYGRDLETMWAFTDEITSLTDAMSDDMETYALDRKWNLVIPRMLLAQPLSSPLAYLELSTSAAFATIEDARARVLADSGFLGNMSAVKNMNSTFYGQTKLIRRRLGFPDPIRSTVFLGVSEVIMASWAYNELFDRWFRLAEQGRTRRQGEPSVLDDPACFLSFSSDVVEEVGRC